MTYWTTLQHALSRLTGAEQVHLALAIVGVLVIAAFTQIALRRGGYRSRSGAAPFNLN
ncbi:MAG TPA: hypothetical protein VGG42_09995 [Acidobacteriaceae bacterium]|jgi:hypothetical protein